MIRFGYICTAAALHFLFATPSLAQETAVPGPEDRIAVQQCLEAVRNSMGKRSSCIGVVSAPCLAKPENQTTQGMVQCTNKEHAIWDDYLSTYYRELHSTLPEPARTELRNVQRAWLKYRDTLCAFPLTYHGGGTIAQPIMANCRLEETARRTHALAELLDGLQ